MCFSLIQNKAYCLSVENLILCYIFPYSTRLLGFPVPWWKSALSWSNPFDTEIINKTLIDLWECQTDPTVAVLGDQNPHKFLFLFIWGQIFTFKPVSL